ncbi:MAG: hypothetical protein Q8R15_02430 [Candidatus Micrarchaeota archaeon]|nr:hypothetical protein [Candidatus Micrarchaeota archaeon]
MGKGAYIKGARFERQLKEMLRLAGFWVIRSSKSGVDGLAPDLIALGRTKRFALECKAWKAGLHFPKPKVEIMKQFEDTTNIPFYIAWKQPREEWRFYPLNALKETPRGYSLQIDDLAMGMTFNNLTGKNASEKQGEKTNQSATQIISITPQTTPPISSTSDDNLQ